VKVKGAALAESGAQTFDLFEHDGANGTFDAVLVSRMDWDVQVVELPPVPDREAAEALRFRMRGLVPGPVDEVAYDFRIQRSEDGAAAAVVAIAPTDTVAAYRAVCGRRRMLLPFQLLSSAVLPAPESMVLFWHPEWIELLYYEGARLARSVVFGRAGDLREDAERAASFPPNEQPPSALLCVAAEREGQAVVSALEEHGVVVVSTVTLESLVARRHAASTQGLFRRSSWHRRWRASALAAVLFLAAAALGLSYLYRLVRIEHARGDALAAAYAAREHEMRHVVALRGEVRELEGRVQDLRAAEPIDLYAVVSQLAVALGTDAVITSLTLNGRVLQADVTARNPLERAKGLAETRVFEDVRVDRVTPIAGDRRERFSLQGVIRAE
jgi:hypothetical protein